MNTKNTRPARKSAQKPAPTLAVHLHPHVLQILADDAVIYIVTTPERVPDEHPASLQAFAAGFVLQTAAKLTRFDATGREIA